MDEDPRQRPFRQAVHTILFAISGSDRLQTSMIMKGGILLALGYDSARFTKDIDFSTDTLLQDFDLQSFLEEFDASLSRAVDKLGYALDCRVQSCKQQPPGRDKQFPTIRTKVGYAYKGDERAQRRLIAKQSLQVVQVDYSLNEPVREFQLFEVANGKPIRAYKLCDLIGEKFRALLQQEERNRIRRQDIFDLHFLLMNLSLIDDSDTMPMILQSIKERAEARNLVITRESMRNPDIVRRSKADYGSLQDEIEGVLPPFDEVYDTVRFYFEGLPWDT